MGRRTVCSKQKHEVLVFAIIDIQRYTLWSSADTGLVSEVTWLHGQRMSVAINLWRHGFSNRTQRLVCVREEDLWEEVALAIALNSRLSKYSRDAH